MVSAAATQTYDPAILSRAWARSAARRMAPPEERAPAPVAAPRWTVEELEKARRDPAAFNEFVLRDEEGHPVTNAPHHIAILDLLTREARAAILAFAEAAKTTAVTIGRVLWELGHNPNLRVGILCDTSEKAAELVGTIGRYIRESEELHAVFPGLRPGRKEADPLLKLKGRWVKWTMHSFTVDRSSKVRDPSVRAASVGKPVQGVRFDLLICDDVVTWETSITDKRRKKLSRWFKNAIAGRLSARSRVWILNTAYHPQDLVHEYARKAGYGIHRFPMRASPGAKVSLWPGRWTPEALAQRIEDLGGEGSVEVARQIDAVPSNDNSLAFPESYILRALEVGNDLHVQPDWPAADIPEGAIIVAGVDIAASEKATADESAIVVLLCFPRGSLQYGYPPGYFQVLWIEAGRWATPETHRRVHDVCHRFACVAYVEDNGVQRFLRQFPAPPQPANETEPRRPAVILPFQTGANKMSPTQGVASLGYDMSAGRTAIPNMGGAVDEQVGHLLGELRMFAPGEHYGDRLMALWIAREGARKHAVLTGGAVDVMVVGGSADADERDEYGERPRRRAG
jgi:hypothetical protein